MKLLPPLRFIVFMSFLIVLPHQVWARNVHKSPYNPSFKKWNPCTCQNERNQNPFFKRDFAPGRKKTFSKRSSAAKKKVAQQIEVKKQEQNLSLPRTDGDQSMAWGEGPGLVFGENRQSATDAPENFNRQIPSPVGLGQ